MITRLTIVLLLGDIILSVLAIIAGLTMRFGFFPFFNEQSGLIGTNLSLIVFTVLFSTYFLELYNQEKAFGKKELLIKVLIVFLLSFTILSAIYYLIPSVMVGRGILALSLCTFVLLQYSWHVGYKICLNLPGFAMRVLIIGTGPLAKKIGKLVTTTNHNHVLGGYINCESEPVHVPSESILQNRTSLIDTVKKEKAHKIIVSLSDRRGTFPLDDVLSCKLSGIEVLDAPSFYEELTGKLMIENITPSWFIFSDGFRITSLKKTFKKTFDAIFAAIGLILASPLILIIAILTKIDSPGPIFFRQVRTGEGERDFVLYKFRTMHQDAESKTGAVWAQKNDPRVTRVGMLLRKMRFDEIPQLYNVLRGEMSFIGPRPERPEFITELNNVIPFYSERHVVRPGITGWAQVRYPYGASVEDAIEKLRYDLYYVKHLSMFLDLVIILETIKVVIFGKGGR